jgi:hypothetical protein
MSYSQQLKLISLIHPLVKGDSGEFVYLFLPFTIVIDPEVQSQPLRDSKAFCRYSTTRMASSKLS